MSTPYESAKLLLELYTLRREATMREARIWFARSFNPASADDVVQAMSGPNSAHFRMVTSYWEMAASFVNHGAIDEAMFADANGEHIGMFAKVAPYLAEFRTKVGMPYYLTGVEKMLMKVPGMAERLEASRERFRKLNAMAPTR